MNFEPLPVVADLVAEINREIAARCEGSSDDFALAAKTAAETSLCALILGQMAEAVDGRGTMCDPSAARVIGLLADIQVGTVRSMGEATWTAACDIGTEVAEMVYGMHIKEASHG